MSTLAVGSEVNTLLNGRKNRLSSKKHSISFSYEATLGGLISCTGTTLSGGHLQLIRNLLRELSALTPA